MKKIYSLIVLFTIILLSSCTKDETNPFGNIYGIVLNSNTAEPIQGARVTLTPTGKSTVTGNDGSYEFVDLEAGSYKVTVQADGYSSTVKNVTVNAGERGIGDVSLSPKAQNNKLGVDKDIVNFTKDISTNTIYIQNLGNAGDINWEITGIPSWLDVSPVQGSTGVGKSSAITLKLNNSFTGKANGAITINASDESINVNIIADNTTEGGNPDGDGDEEDNSDDYSSATITSCDPDIEVGITSCKRSGNTVVFKFYAINKKQSDISSFRLYDLDKGSEIADDEQYYNYSNTDIKFASKSLSVGEIATSLVKDTKTNGEVTIQGVSNNITKFNLIKLKVKSYDSNIQLINEYIEFRNVPIY